MPLPRGFVLNSLACSRSFGWFGLTLVYLVHYGAWVDSPLQAMNLFGATLPALHIGPHFQEFWIARACDIACVIGIAVAALGLGVIVTDRLVAKRDILGALLALAVGFWLLAVLVLVVGSVSIAKVPLVASHCLAGSCLRHGSLSGAFMFRQTEPTAGRS